ncbi:MULTISPECIES: hypothetical protein [unclassified Microcoleus]
MSYYSYCNYASSLSRDISAFITLHLRLLKRAIALYQKSAIAHFNS